MSAGGPATVALVDLSAFHARARSFNSPVLGAKVPLIVNGTVMSGWTVTEAPLINTQYRFILRTSMDGLKDTGVFACILMSEDGVDLKICQFILVENDDDFARRGAMRYEAFSAFAALRS